MRYSAALFIIAFLLLGCSAPGILSMFSGASAASSELSEPVLVGDAEQGEAIFKMGVEDAPACANCHSTLLAGGSAGFAFGPSLVGVMERAGERVNGLSAEAYVHQSIVSPGSYLVPGFRNMMFSRYGEHLTEQDIADLIAYLSTL